MDESGVYYTPSVGFSHHHLPDSQEIQHSGYTQDAHKQCSVKGCADMLSSNDPNRMCDGCRNRHRIYASTKRAKRKLEKAAIVNTVVTCGVKDIQEMSLIGHATQPITWVTPDGQSHQDLQPSTSPLGLSTWNHTIDPRLFSGDVSPASTHHLSPPKPHQTSTTSELANALTPRQPSTPVPLSAPSILPSQMAADYNEHFYDPTVAQQQSSHLQVPPQPYTSITAPDESNDNNEEPQVIASLQAAIPMQDQHTETAELDQDESSEEVDGSARFCSVKGCKAIISASYEYKMCPPCRTRYRTYGNTKRAKWKAERDAFDREMASLRTLEDEKRKTQGFRPLAESPQELRAWELSIIDEQVPLIPVDKCATLPGTSPTAESALAQSLPSPSTNSPMVLAGVYPPKIPSSSAVDLLQSISPYPHLNNNPLLAAAANTSLRARMCTVSHCHKILPGYYRYKRCEQHRLQNRHHSQLKRVREKEVKAAGETLVDIHLEEASGKAEQDKQDKIQGTKQEAALTTDCIEEGKEASVMTGDGDFEGKSHDQKHSKLSCSAGDCHNLLLPTVRWRSCEPCRTIDRRRKNQIKFEQKAAEGNYYWSERMNTDPPAVAISKDQCPTEGNGNAQELQQTTHVVLAAAVDPDAEGDIDVDDNEDESDSKADENQQPTVTPMTAPPPPASITSGFSRFHVKIDPKNASSSAPLDPTTSTAKLVTLDDPLAFRAYRPKTTPSAIGRILARNPGLSVDAFTEVLGATTAPLQKQANETSSPKPIITPTIPTSAPFVYKAPEKKNTSMRGTIGKGKRKVTSSEKQSTSSTVPATPSPASGASTASAPPGSYGPYGYPYPYPYYIPAPYGIPPFPYPQATTPIPSDSKRKSKSFTSAVASSSSPTPVSPSTPIPGYSPYPYFYPPQLYGYPLPPGGYPYMSARYMPGQPPYNGLPPGSSSTKPYPYPYYPPPSAPAPVPIPTSAPFPKTAAAARERQRTQDTQFNYYHYGVGSSDSPAAPAPSDKKKKRRKVDPDYLEKFKAQTEAISISLTAKRDTLNSAPTPLPVTDASDGSNVSPSAQSEMGTVIVDTGALSKPVTPTRPCANKTCQRSVSIDTANTLCNKCRLRFKKHQAKTKKRFKLEPRKFLLNGKSVSEKQGSVDEGIEIEESE